MHILNYIMSWEKDTEKLILYLEIIRNNPILNIVSSQIDANRIIIINVVAVLVKILNVSTFKLNVSISQITY